MFDALLARTADGLTHLNTIALPTVRIRFQICPGVDTGLGIGGVAYKLLSNGAEFKSGTTDANGEVAIPILLITQGGAVLHIFETDYELSFHTLKALTSVAGQEKRLEVMGYFTGYQLVALRNNTIDDGNDSTNFQQAIMNFQTDQTIKIDGDIGPQTRGKMQSADGE